MLVNHTLSCQKYDTPIFGSVADTKGKNHVYWCEREGVDLFHGDKIRPIDVLTPEVILK